MSRRLGLILAGIVLAAACTPSDQAEISAGQSSTVVVTERPAPSTTATTEAETTTTEAPPEPVEVLVFADATDCREPATKVAELVQRTPGMVLIAGDLAYPTGSKEDFDKCFVPLYEPILDRLMTVPGDNDYEADETALPYFETLGVEVAANPGQGWWVHETEAWQIFGLNSSCSKVDYCGPKSPQYAFVAEAIENSPGKCRMAVWHHPRFTSSPSYDGLKNMGDLYELLVDNGADLLVVGHSHHYERFEPIDQFGEPNPDGMSNFTVGTGGAPFTQFGDALPGSMVRNNTSRGVLSLSLNHNSYAWEFLATEGDLQDSGEIACHNR